MVKVAAVQATPVFLDREATVEKACELAAKASAEGAEIVVFPEAFVPAYPDWVWRTPAWDDAPFIKLLYANAVTVPGPVTQRLGQSAAKAGVYLVVGVNEIDGGTLYNTLLYFDPTGALVNRHRKLMATGGERTVWGYGDGSGLGVVHTPHGVVGGLLCWENYMPLARAALYAQHVDIYLAPTWDNGDTWIASMRHIAKEGRCHVISVAPVLRGADIPEELRGALYRGEDDWCSRGNSLIAGPDGELLAGPISKREDIIYADCDVDAARASRREFDPVGHYARPDVFTLTVDRSSRRSVTFTASR